MANERILLERLARLNPNDKCVLQDDCKVVWERDIQRIFQKKNCSGGVGHLSEELQSWIKNNIRKYSIKLTSAMVKEDSRVRYMYFGMIYTIFQYNGFYLLGKNNNPVNITCNKYCQLLGLNRKTLSREIYSFDFYEEIELESKVNQSWIKTYYKYDDLIEIFNELEKEILEF